MTTIPAPPKTLSQVGRAAQDLGLAGLLGGTLFGRMALHPAVASISDPRERGEVVNAAWRRYGFVNSASLAAVTLGWIGARAAEAADRNLTPAERRLARVKDGVVGAPGGGGGAGWWVRWGWGAGRGGGGAGPGGAAAGGGGAGGPRGPRGGGGPPA